MFHYRDKDNNLIASSRELSAPSLVTITEEEYMAAIELLKEKEADNVLSE